MWMEHYETARRSCLIVKQHKHSKPWSFMTCWMYIMPISKLVFLSEWCSVEVLMCYCIFLVQVACLTMCMCICITFPRIAVIHSSWYLLLINTSVCLECLWILIRKCWFIIFPFQLFAVCLVARFELLCRYQHLRTTFIRLIFIVSHSK